MQQEHHSLTEIAFLLMVCLPAKRHVEYRSGPKQLPLSWLGPCHCRPGGQQEQKVVKSLEYCCTLCWLEQTEAALFCADQTCCLACKYRPGTTAPPPQFTRRAVGPGGAGPAVQEGAGVGLGRRVAPRHGGAARTGVAVVVSRGGHRCDGVALVGAKEGVARERRAAGGGGGLLAGVALAHRLGQPADRRQQQLVGRVIGRPRHRKRLNRASIVFKQPGLAHALGALASLQQQRMHRLRRKAAAAVVAAPHMEADRPAPPVSCTARWQKSPRAWLVLARTRMAARSCRAGGRVGRLQPG